MRQGTQGHRGGCRLLSPSTYTRAKYRQPHRSGGQTPKHRDTGKDTRGSMAPAASQFGRTAGDNRRYWGGRQINEKRTERRQEEGREMHAWATCLETWSSGGGISGGGERGDHSHQWTITHNPKYMPESSVWGAAVQGLEHNTTL